LGTRGRLAFFPSARALDQQERDQARVEASANSRTDMMSVLEFAKEE
jgi:hypothetical protein